MDKITQDAINDIRGRLLKPINEGVTLDEAISPEKQKELLDMMLGVMANGGEIIYQELAKTVKEIQDKQAVGGTKKAKQKKPVSNEGNPLEVGDIMNEYFSYTMTFNNFYQITEIKGKKVTMMAIEKEWVPGSGDIGWYGQVRPIPKAYERGGNVITFTLRGNFVDKKSVSIRVGNKRIFWVDPKDTHYENHLD